MHFEMPCGAVWAAAYKTTQLAAWYSEPGIQSLVLHTASPLSNTMRQLLSGSSRQIELKRPTILPSSYTGPVLSASFPEARTSRRSGAHENGALRPSEDG